MKSRTPTEPKSKKNAPKKLEIQQQTAKMNQKKAINESEKSMQADAGKHPKATVSGQQIEKSGKEVEIENLKSSSDSSQTMPSPDEIMASAHDELQAEKEKKLIDFLTRLVVKSTLKEFYEQKY